MIKWISYPNENYIQRNIELHIELPAFQNRYLYGAHYITDFKLP